MAQSQFTDDEVERRGKELYEQTIRDQVETDENIGKFVVMDLESGDYEVDKDLIQAGKRLIARRPEGRRWAERIGYDVAFVIGGTRNRTSR